MNKKDILDKIKNLDGLSNEERAYLVNLVNTKKKYGLVWEDKPEEVEEQLRTKLPILKEVKERAIINDTESDKHPNHILIEGDNLHALTALTFTHENKIDLIYIDPPYNTGNKDFIYNDHYVDKEDSYRHSKWLSFMHKRLQIAHKLLADDGSIFISIDDNEYPRIVMIIEELFGKRNVKTICVKMSEPTGVKMASVIQNGRIPKLKEYIIIAKKNGIRDLEIDKIPKQQWDDEYNKIIIGVSKNEIKQLKEIQNKENLTTEDVSNADSILSSWKYIGLSSHLSEQKITSKTDIEKFKFDNAWRIIQIVTLTGGASLLAKEKNSSTHQEVGFFSILTPRGKFYIIRNNFNNDTKLPRCKVLFADDYLTIHPGDFWSDIKTTGLDNEGGVDFKNGKKPLRLLERIIRTNPKENFTCLDFFAGSGTTLEACVKIKQEYKKGIQSILVTDNGFENEKIAEKITYIRALNSFKKYSRNNNLRYYQCDFVNREPSLANKRQLTQLATELLCIKEDSYQEVTSTLNSEAWNKLFTNGNGQYVYVVYDDLYIEEAVEALTQFVAQEAPESKIKVYVFANGQYAYAEEFEDIAENITLAALPDAIYKAYQNVLPKENKDFVPVLEEDMEAAEGESDLFNQQED
jgi:adenine-specific DNA-methyltransferase